MKELKGPWAMCTDCNDLCCVCTCDLDDDEADAKVKFVRLYYEEVEDDE